jgi:hypothetical protein
MVPPAGVSKKKNSFCVEKILSHLVLDGDSGFRIHLGLKKTYKG